VVLRRDGRDGGATLAGTRSYQAAPGDDGGCRAERWPAFVDIADEPAAPEPRTVAVDPGVVRTGSRAPQ